MLRDTADIIDAALASLGGADALLVANTLPWPRLETHCLTAAEVAHLSPELQAATDMQPTHDGGAVGAQLIQLAIAPGVATLAEAAAAATAHFTATAAHETQEEPPLALEVLADGTGVVLSNSHLRAVVAAGGVVSSLIHLATGREVVESGSQGCNRYLLFEDLPLSTDGWDIDIYHKGK